MHLKRGVTYEWRRRAVNEWIKGVFNPSACTGQVHNCLAPAIFSPGDAALRVDNIAAVNRVYQFQADVTIRSIYHCTELRLKGQFVMGSCDLEVRTVSGPVNIDLSQRAGEAARG